MYADIVVLTYQSPDINYFTYLIPKNLEKEIKVGQLVQVPFGNRIPMGIVVGLHVSHPEPFDVIASETKQSQGKLREGSRDSFASAQNDRSKNQNDKRVVIKPISSIVLKTPLLLPYQVELLKWMSAYYIAPMVNCLKAMLPTAALNAKRLLTNASGWQSWKGSRQRADSKQISDKSTNELNRALAGGKRLTGPATNQVLVLIPTLNRLPQVLAQFPKAKNYVTYHNELKTSEKFSTWLKIQSGKVDYIFGSRSAIFVPCPNLKEIIIFDEHDGAYKDERSPYFDTLTVAQKISELTGAQIKIIDSSPKISTYFTHSTAHLRGNPEMSSLTRPATFDVVSIDFHLRGEKGTRAKIVSMKEERLTGNFSPISDYLLTRLKTSQNSLLFLNKKKESGSLYCKSCNTHIYLEKQPENCPNCNSSDFYFNLLNITSLAREVRSQIPDAKINLISDSSNYPAIDIATASIFYAPQILKYDLVAFISPDALLNRADFSSGETLYEQIVNLKTLLKKDGVLILQTQNPENLTIKSAASSNYPAYYNEQLKLRRALFYPPFALLIKLTLKGKDQEKVQSKAHEITNRLKYQIQNTKYKIPVTILGPFTPFFFSKMPTYNIIIKCKLESYSLAQREKAIGKLQHLRNLKDVQVTVEPESIN